jgi:hypothetical protein
VRIGFVLSKLCKSGIADIEFGFVLAKSKFAPGENNDGLSDSHAPVNRSPRENIRIYLLKSSSD